MELSFIQGSSTRIRCMACMKEYIFRFGLTRYKEEQGLGTRISYRLLAE